MPDSNQVVRHSRRLMTQFEQPVAADTQAGMLVEETANGIQPHSTAGVGVARIMVAKDDRTIGMTLGDTYDGTNSVNAKYLVCSGGGVHLLLAAGESVTEHDRLVSAGDGTVRLIDQDGTAPDDPDSAMVASVAEGETVDNTGGTEPAPVAVEVAQK